MVLTPDLIRARLASTGAPVDPSKIVFAAPASPWAAVLKEAPQKELIVAGVLIALIERDGEWLVLLTKRSSELRVHAGQVSFPGGRKEAKDRDIIATALRETHEEVGIAPSDIDVIGCLRTLPTMTGYAVTPVVGFVSHTTPIVEDANEVDFAFDVPLKYLLDRDNERWVEREIRGRMLPMLEYQWSGQRIWGATAYIIESLRKILLKE